MMEMFLETIKAWTDLMYPNPSLAHNYIHGHKNSTSAGPLQLRFLSHMLDLWTNQLTWFKSHVCGQQSRADETSSWVQDREEKGPGFCCLHIRLITVEFHLHHGQSIFVCL